MNFFDSSQKVKTMAHAVGLTSLMICLKMAILFESSLAGLTYCLKTRSDRSIYFESWVTSEQLNLVAQSAVGIFLSLSPGVSIRVNASSSTISGFYVTPYTESFASNAASDAPCTLFRKVDFPVPNVPRVMMFGLKGTLSTI